ncbi:MAG TPA: DUF2520 domain-containing protein [Solirubrobacteraceae bacterium]|nr:DUF2520 domain-containing protein [Solirubrobacteraceae bacterium]
MRELERPSQPSSARAPHPCRVALVGDGRVGNLLATALREAGTEVTGPLGRGARPRDADAVLLCVPDAEIGAAAALVPPGPPVGHCSGATGLSVLRPHEAFSLHPLMTITAGADPSVLHGAAAAIAGTSAGTVELARSLVARLGLRPVQIAVEDRIAYHAAASIASNFLITLEAAAERLGATAGLERADLVPLVRAAVENWARFGPEQALTGPVARGDELTVAAQRAAVGERAPELLALFDGLTEATRALAAGGATLRC